jgi:hypothetical protein
VQAEVGKEVGPKPDVKTPAPASLADTMSAVAK